MSQSEYFEYDEDVESSDEGVESDETWEASDEDSESDEAFTESDESAMSRTNPMSPTNRTRPFTKRPMRALTKAMRAWKTSRAMRP